MSKAAQELAKAVKAKKAAQKKEVSTGKGKPVKEASTPKGTPVKEASTPKGKPVEAKAAIRQRDPRVPRNGTVLTGHHKGKDHHVTVDAAGFIFKGKTYRSLSAIAKEIAGCPWNGFAFFGLIAKPTKTSAAA